MSADPQDALASNLFPDQENMSFSSQGPITFAKSVPTSPGNEVYLY